VAAILLMPLQFFPLPPSPVTYFPHGFAMVYVLPATPKLLAVKDDATEVLLNFDSLL
jgi:hypothetical protein